MKCQIMEVREKYIFGAIGINKPNFEKWQDMLKNPYFYTKLTERNSTENVIYCMIPFI